MEEGAGGARPKILLVDDRPENLTALESILAGEEVELVRAGSGAEALRLALHEEFALIVLDVVMPGIDGFEVASLLKGRERTRHVPIVFLTAARAGDERLRRAYTLGAVDFIEKPVDPEAVRAKVAGFVDLWRRRETVRREQEVRRASERRAAERAIAALRRASERRYRSLAEAIPQMVWTTDGAGAIDYVNARFVAHTGLSLERAREEGLAPALHPEDAEPFLRRFREAVAARQPFEAEARWRVEGGFRWHLTRALPERDEQGAVVAWLATTTDIDDQKRAEVALRAAQARAEALYEEATKAVRVRDEFLSVASHELRTPLTALKLQLQGVVRSIRRGGPVSPAELRAGIEVATRQVARIEKLVATLLDVSCLAEGRGLGLEREVVDLGSLARDAVARFDGELAAAGTAATVVIEENVRGRWDPLRMEQVLTNLLSNAVKYGRGRPIEVRVGRRGDVARVSVKDRGIGIPPEHRERIFERFARAVSPLAYGGLGLGLFIAREIVRAHGGRIEVESVLGEGATFTVELPGAAPAPPPPPPPPAETDRGARDGSGRSPAEGQERTRT